MKTSKQLTKDVLADLFLRMSMKDEKKEAEKAFIEFYHRYKNYIYTVIRKACESWKQYGKDLIQSTFSNVLLIVYKKADSFIMIENVEISRQELRLKAWLGKIIQIEILKLLKLERTNDEMIEFTDKLLEYDDKVEKKSNIPISYNMSRLEDALATLSEREKDILMTYFAYSEGNKKLPREELQRLAKRWDILPDNMRQIKRRSLKKIEKILK